MIKMPPNPYKLLTPSNRLITEHLKLLMRLSGAKFYSSSEFEIVKEIKEHCCAIKPRKKSPGDSEADPIIYKLPDGSKITVCNFRNI